MGSASPKRSPKFFAQAYGMFSPELLAAAASLLESCRAAKWTIATAESCTGGLVAGLLTDIPGASDVFDRGFVTYSNAAKTAMLGVSQSLITVHGAVSAEVARAMAEGALLHSPADLAIAITGVAGPSGGTPEKPVGLVYFAAMRKGQPATVRMFHFPAGSRQAIRMSCVHMAIALLDEVSRE